MSGVVGAIGDGARLVVVALIVGVGAVPATGAADPRPRVDPRVIADAADGDVDLLVVLREQATLTDAAKLRTKRERGELVHERLLSVAERTQPPVVAAIEAAGAEHRRFWITNMIAVRGDASAVAALTARADVAALVSNRPLGGLSPRIELSTSRLHRRSEGAEWNVERVKAPSMWERGSLGEGVVVGIIDTGVDWQHPAIASSYRGAGPSVTHAYHWHDAIHSGGGRCGADSPEPCDDLGHGTFTTGLVVGDGESGARIGVAPRAEWIGCRAMDRGVGTPARYAECLQWMLAPTDADGDDADPGLAPDVVNNSWSCPPDEGCEEPGVLGLAIESLRAAGIVVIAAADNNGPACGSIDRPPAHYDATFTVGATDHDDQIWVASSRGPVTIDGSGRVKPDVVAPGVNVRSSLPGPTYGRGSGTSFAAPHASGLAALLISFRPELRGEVDLVEGLLRGAARPLPDVEECGGLGSGGVPNNASGWGRIEAPRCVAGPRTLCLADGRFELSVEWVDFRGRTGRGHAVPLDRDRPSVADTGFFWFFRDDNYELMIKALDGCKLNRRHWLFVSSASTVQYDITVIDLATEAKRTYSNGLGEVPRLIADTSAFGTCP